MAANVNVDDLVKKLRPAKQAWVKARIGQLAAEEMTLRELRRARKLTQARIAKAQGISQDSVSRLEQRSDLLLSTLRKTLEAMGGRLSLMVQFKDRAPVILAGLAEGDIRSSSAGKKSARASRTVHA